MTRGPRGSPGARQSPSARWQETRRGRANPPTTCGIGSRRQGFGRVPRRVSLDGVRDEGALIKDLIKHEVFVIAWQSLPLRWVVSMFHTVFVDNDHDWDPKFEAPGSLLGLLGGGLFKGGASQEPTVCTKRYAEALQSPDATFHDPRVVGLRHVLGLATR